MEWQENRYWNYNGLDDQFILDFESQVGKATRCSDFRIFALGEFRYSNYLRSKRRVKTLRTQKTGFLCCLKWYSRHDVKGRKIQDVEMMWIYLTPKKNMYRLKFFFSENCRRTHRKAMYIMRLLDQLSSQKIAREANKDMESLTKSKNEKLFMAKGAKEYRLKYGKKAVEFSKQEAQNAFDARIEELNISIAKFKTIRVSQPDKFDDCEKAIKQCNKEMEKLRDKYNDKIKSLDLNSSIVEDEEIQLHIFRTEVQAALDEFDSSVKKLDSLKLYKSEYSKAAASMSVDDILLEAFGSVPQGPEPEINGGIQGPEQITENPEVAESPEEKPKAKKGKGKKLQVAKLATTS